VSARGPAVVVLQNGEATHDKDGGRVVAWWSLTKAAIAIAVLDRVMDDPTRLDKPFEGHGYTLRHLLQHRSGLPDYSEQAAYREAVAAGALPWDGDELFARTGTAPVHFAPGTGFRYSNVGYALLRRWLERRADMPIGEIISSRVLIPMGLADVRMALVPTDLVDVEMGTASGYHPGFVHHGLLVGPARSAARFVDGLVASSVLPEALRLQMFEPRDVAGSLPGRPWLRAGYGLGLMIGITADGFRVLGHTGGGPGSQIAAYTRHGDGPSRTAVVAGTGDDQSHVERMAFDLLRSA
jgi:CubicO group peptidase (beta-lactamase class C family)